MPVSTMPTLTPAPVTPTLVLDEARAGHVDRGDQLRHGGTVVALDLRAGDEADRDDRAHPGQRGDRLQRTGVGLDREAGDEGVEHVARGERDAGVGGRGLHPVDGRGHAGARAAVDERGRVDADEPDGRLGGEGVGRGAGEGVVERRHALGGAGRRRPVACRSRGRRRSGRRPAHRTRRAAAAAAAAKRGQGEAAGRAGVVPSTVSPPSSGRRRGTRPGRSGRRRRRRPRGRARP